MSDDPIVFETSTAKTILGLCMTCVIVGVFVAAPYDGREMSSFGWVLLWLCRIISFAVFASYVWRLIQPPRIVAAPSGFTYTGYGRHCSLAWSEIKSFDYVKGSVFFTRGIVNITPASDTPANKRLPCFTVGWDRSLADLAATLNQLRARWR